MEWVLWCGGEWEWEGTLSRSSLCRFPGHSQVGDYLLGGWWSRQLLPPTFSLLEPGNMYCRYNRYHLLSNMPCLVLVVFLLSSSSPASAPLPPLP